MYGQTSFNTGSGSILFVAPVTHTTVYVVIDTVCVCVSSHRRTYVASTESYVCCPVRRQVRRRRTESPRSRAVPLRRRRELPPPLLPLLLLTGTHCPPPVAACPTLPIHRNFKALVQLIVHVVVLLARFSPVSSPSPFKSCLPVLFLLPVYTYT